MIRDFLGIMSLIGLTALVVSALGGGCYHEGSPPPTPKPTPDYNPIIQYHEKGLE